MPAPRVAHAAQLAAQLRGVGIAATHDPAKLAGQLPALLVRPPRLAFDQLAGATATWSLLLVADAADELTAWTQLDELLTDVEDQLPVELADPASYQLATDAPARPAYALTYTDTVES